MNFDDERFVKIYPRNTTNWKLLGWEGRCVLMMLFREVDRAGCLDIEGGMDGLALLLDLPPDVTERGFAACVKRGTVVQNGNLAIIPNFTRAQDARQTDRVRQAESRARRREVAMSQNVTKVARTVTERDEMSHDVTDSHTESHDVTLRIDQTRPDQNKDSCARSESKQPEIALVPQRAAVVKQPKAQVIAQIAVTLFGELQAARKRCNANVRWGDGRKVLPAHTREIERCLREEMSVDDLRHVIAVWEAMVKSGRQEMAYFDSVTPFRAANVAKYLQMSLDDARKPRGQAPQATRPPEPPKSPQPAQSDFERRRKELESSE
jgi:hypothetical protein